jgi:hypothetical protein
VELRICRGKYGIQNLSGIRATIILWFGLARRLDSTRIKRGTLEINLKKNIFIRRPRTRGFSEVLKGVEKGKG